MALILRVAVDADLDALIALFAADDLGGHGDTLDAGARPLYAAAFVRIAAQPGTTLHVAELDGAVVGTYQLTFVPGLSTRGAIRAILEGVQVRGDMRSRGIGEAMVRQALEQAREGGAAGLQLTSNLKRTDAHRFYERLGFSKSHAGFKLMF